ESQKGKAAEVLNGSREQIDGQKELAKTMESLDREITEINEAARGLLTGIKDITEQASNLRSLSEA
ncbi:MAG: methyl-accepting chemotaxis protein, partial [Leptospiraceae bacterium]|nr:methyl-accepting chemotaxis protein [Leptospiraceae bacterium]